MRIHRTLFLIVLLPAAAAIMLPTLPLAAYPTPSMVRKSWQIDMTPGKPKTIAVRDIDGELQWFWFLPYRAVNRTGQEQFFVPEVTIATDRGDIIRAGRKVPPRVFDAIKSKLENEFLEHPMQVSGRLLLGEDHARESVAIWPVFAHDIDRMTVFFAGLSGETKMVRNPQTGEDVELRKTLMMTYRVPGTHTHPQMQPVKQAEQKWIMR